MVGSIFNALDVILIPEMKFKSETDSNIFFFRSNDFKEDDAIWKNGEDGGAGGGGPPPQGGPAMGPTGGYVAK